MSVVRLERNLAGLIALTMVGVTAVISVVAAGSLALSQRSWVLLPLLESVVAAIGVFVFRPSTTSGRTGTIVSLVHGAGLFLFVAIGGVVAPLFVAFAIVLYLPWICTGFLVVVSVLLIAAWRSEENEIAVLVMAGIVALQLLMAVPGLLR